MYNEGLNFRRHDTQKFEVKPGVEIHVSHLVLLPDDEVNKRDYVEVREFSVAGEVYGHGLLFPRDLSAYVAQAIEEVADDQ